MKYMEKPRIVDATQWFKNGDHPDDNVWRPFEDTGKVPTEPREGAVVRYYRHPCVSGTDVCFRCNHTMHEHGWIDIGEEGLTVCPGDYVVTDKDGFHWRYKPEIFEKTYDPIN